MYPGVRSPLVYTPRTLGELATLIGRHPQATLWAGGTHLMRKTNFYPSGQTENIIDIAEIEELKRITRTDRYVEIGALVTASQLLSAGRLLLPALLQETLRTLGTQVVRRRVTVGGALAVADLRYSLPTALAVLPATVEVKRYKEGKVSTHWITASKLYDSEGALTLTEGRFLITRVRIGLEFGDFQRMMRFGDPVRNPKECGIVAFHAKREQNGLSKAQICFNFPTKAFHISRDLESKLAGSALPIHPDKVNTFSHELAGELKKTHPTVSDLQLERARRVFEALLHELSGQVLL
ncbi:MAG TPA: FAD binding domain-containing protein [Sphaerochaeta sp.]|nr:FAD binding domain-containing protein [Sphaerochaeta sp.]